jgi:ElaB/YqjD/DUF883 family membrane-anchored ribosome-binding protein
MGFPFSELADRFVAKTRGPVGDLKMIWPPAPVALILLVLSSVSLAENLEKTQKKELGAQAKAIIAEAQSLEKSGQVAEARAKYAESQAMIEMKEAVDAIKRLDDEIHKRIKEMLNQSRKLYEAHKYKEAALTLEESTKLGAPRDYSHPILRSAITSWVTATKRSRI